MLKKVLEFVLNKLIGLDKLTPQQRKELRDKVLIYAHNLAVDMAKGSAEGFIKQYK